MTGNQQNTVFKTASLGGQQVLPCEIIYPPEYPDVQYVVTWTKQGLNDSLLIKFEGYNTQIQEQYKERIEIVNKEASLRISHIEPDDEGWYGCEVYFASSKDTARKTPSIKTWVYLTVHSPPQILRTSNTTLNLLKGSNIELFCEGTGSPEPKIVWKKDNQALNNTLRVTVSGNRVRINNVQREDGGMYSCTFQNLVGETSQPIKLVLEGGPVIMQRPSNITVVDGQRVVLPCVIEAFPQPISFTWYKDTVDIRTTDSFMAQRISILDDGSLLIKPAVKTDRAWYTCKASNSLGNDEAPAYLNIIYKPEVITQKMPAEITWAKGYLQQIDCPVDANPPLKNVLWTKDQNSVSSMGRFDILENGTLLVSNVEESDAGSYKCTPYNVLGSGPSSPRVQVQVKDPPRITISPDPLYIRNVGESVQMGCEATGTPSVSVHWIKVGSKIEGDPRITVTDKYLEIKDLTKDDHGKYECRAINDVATVVSVTELRVSNTTPYAPYNVTVVPGLFNASISWEPAYDGGTTPYYFVNFRAVGDPQWTTMNVEAKSSSAITVFGLQPDTEYEFRIVARNAYGDGTTSSVVRQRTLAVELSTASKLDTTTSHMAYDPKAVLALPVDREGVPYYPEISENKGPSPSEPQNLSAQVRDKDIILNWKVPLISPVPIFSYKIEYSHENSNWIIYPVRVIGGSTSYAEMKDMGSGTYNIRLRSYGVLAFSIPSKAARVTVPSDDLVLPEALIGGIIGGVLFLLVAVLLALVAIFHSRKKDRKAKSKYNDVTYGKPDEMNGRHEPTPKWDRWQHNGGGDFVTSLDNRDGIFFLPQTRRLDQSADMRSSLVNDVMDSHSYGRSVAAGREGYDQDAGRQVPLTHDISFRSDRSQAGSFRARPDVKNSTWPDQHSVSQLPLSRSLPLNSGHLPHTSYAPLHKHANAAPPPPVILPTSHEPPTLPKSVSFPAPHSSKASELPTISKQHPSQSAQYVNHPSYHHHNRSHSGSSLRDTQHPSFQSDDDEVFGAVGPHPPLFPRHSSMKPSQMTYLTDDDAIHQPNIGAPLFGVEDISSVLEPNSEQLSQNQPSHSTSASSHPINNFNFDSDIPAPGYYVNTGDTNRPFAMVTPSQKHRAPSDNESNNSSGRPLGYTRDHLQGVVQRLRSSSRSHSAGPHSRYANISGYSDPLPQSRANLFIPPKVSKSHSNLQDPVYYNTVNRRQAPYHMSDLEDDWPRLRAQSDGNHGLRNNEYLGDSASNRPSLSYPDMTSLPRAGERSSNDLPIDRRIYPTSRNYPEPPPPKPAHLYPHPQRRPAYLEQAQSSNRFDPREALPTRYTTPLTSFSDPSGQYRHVQHFGEDPVHHDSGSHSSGVGSRNTSQSTGSLHPHRRGSGGKGSTSLSSAHDPDLSLEASHSFGVPAHRRDTSGDENYEFDSLNALENDIIDDLRRYSRLSGNAEGPVGSAHSGQVPNAQDNQYAPRSKPSRYPDSDVRFMKLREEFKQYRQQQLRPDEDLRPPPTASSALPIGQNGEPLYPMDSEML
ncbi:uncharacterized protein LOC106054729 isoform X2 [Biomphalaria glabrata]|uniref:Uncharacterized protein LOC106054729 isoform X2 n=1 Tax=Biomphalaria glabrata TaxID=6526 RepID=A0A9W2YT35_BIOGL|nr:uncharacterized protein LOC106054729 isoform X2 [Biomphalaria glabrata]